MRDVLYGALSRRRRRSLHRKYAELIEKRSAGRLERVYPELVHHFWQGDVPEKTVEYGLKLAQKSLDTFSPEDAIRVAKITLEFLEDEEWAGDPGARGRGAAAARPGRTAWRATSTGALREAEAAVKVFEEREAAPRRRSARSSSRPRRPGRRGGSTTPAAGSSAASRPRARPESRSHLAKLLSLGATVANLRGEYAKAAGLPGRDRDGWRPGRRPRKRRFPAAARSSSRWPNPIAATEPGVYETTEEHEVLANVFETLVTTDAQGNLAPAARANAGRSRTTPGRCGCTCARASSSRTALP